MNTWCTTVCILSLGCTAVLHAQQSAETQSNPPFTDGKASANQLALDQKPEPTTKEKLGLGDWEFEFAPYLWLSSVRADVSAGPISSETNVCFSDLVKHLDMGAMMRLEGRHEHVGFYLEGIYMGLSDDASIKAGPSRVRGIETDVRLNLAELGFGGMYRFGKSDRCFDLMLGGRYTHIGTDVSIGRLIDSESHIDFVAPVAGGRVQFDLSDKWQFSLKGDVGGFGVGEAPDFTWGATALLGYRLSKIATLSFGYRYYEIQNAKGPIDMDIQFHGPMVGLAFKF